MTKHQLIFLLSVLDLIPGGYVTTLGLTTPSQRLDYLPLLCCGPPFLYALTKEVAHEGR